jgi:hypothetical protein
MMKKMDMSLLGFYRREEILGNNTDGKKIFFKCMTIDDVSGETFEVNSPFNDY